MPESGCKCPGKARVRMNESVGYELVQQQHAMASLRNPARHIRPAAAAATASSVMRIFR